MDYTKMSLEALSAERERKLERLNDLRWTLSKMPNDTALAILCVKGYIKKAEKELSKIKKEIANLSR